MTHDHGDDVIASAKASNQQLVASSCF